LDCYITDVISQILLGKMAALVADDRYQKLLTYWRIGPKGSRQLKSKNFVVALRTALSHRIQSVLQFRALTGGIDGRALNLLQVRLQRQETKKREREDRRGDERRRGEAREERGERGEEKRRGEERRGEERGEERREETRQEEMRGDERTREERMGEERMAE
jgi:hypothetical protein